MTANQLVAYNLKRAREERAITQEQASLELYPFLGKRWSVASFSDAERSASNGRTREFDANELLAFSRVFGKPIAWFFTPPDDLEFVHAGAPVDVSRVVSKDELLDSIHGLTLFDQSAFEQVYRAAEMLREVEHSLRGASAEREAASSDAADNEQGGTDAES